MKSKFIKNLIIFSCLGLAIFLVVNPAYALDPGLSYVEGTGLGVEDPRVIAANIIRVILGFLGIVAVSLIIYAGWMWMTAAGNYEKVEKAKKILISAVIGLVIVLSAFAIATFVIGKLLDATGAGGGPGSGPGPGPGPGTSGTSFYVSGSVPHNGQTGVVRNVRIKAFFSRQLQTMSAAALDNNFRVEKIATIDPGTGVESAIAATLVSGTVADASDWRELNFQASAACGDELGTTNCLDAWSKFRVTLNGGSGILAVGGTSLSCVSGSCQFEFSTNNSLDTSGPAVGIVSTQICKDDGTLAATANIVGGWGKDDIGISGINFYERLASGPENLVWAEPGTSATYQFAEHQYNTSAYNIGDSYTFRVEARDMAASASSTSFTTDIKPGHCCNGIMDGGEEDVDCGGPDCLSCALMQPTITTISPAGGFCNSNPNTACLSDADCSGTDTCNTSRPNGSIGNFITISGRFFGSTPGQVFFSGASGWIPAQLANDSVVGNIACTDVWNNTQIIAVVPSGTVNGPIRIETASGNHDESNDTNGPALDDLLVNTIERPGICNLNPDHGTLDDTVTYHGIKMDAGLSYFGNVYTKIAGVNSSFVNPGLGTADVPNLRTGGLSSFVLKGNTYSNYLAFTKDAEPYAGPYINSFEPTSGRPGQYVTIRGGGFGNNRGISKVYFGDASGVEASYAFPDVCADSVWKDNEIIVKVPDGITNGNYHITVEVNGIFTDTSALTPSNFNVDGSLSLAPSLCKISPTLGQNNTEISLWGEYFDAQDANSRVRFFSNNDQTGAAITSWGPDASVTSGIKPDKAVTSIHSAAVTGPVKIVKGAAGLAGNGMNLTIGSCTANADCGGTDVCCPTGSSEEGRCKANEDMCYVTVNACVYNWDFSTGGPGTSTTTPEECSNLPNCCIDAMNGNAVTHGRAGDKNIVLGDTPDLAYCPYWGCSVASSTVCDATASTTGAFDSFASCSTGCSTPGAGPGTSCNVSTTTPVCDINICSPDYSCLLDAVADPSCGTCCCNPGDVNGAGLECLADKGPCSGSNRGLFCGCTVDTECGSPTTAGCGLDTCCRARPIIESVSPAEDATDVCRNAVISAVFNEKMDVGSFSGNIIVVGDYGIDTCPAGTEYLVSLGRPLAVRMADRIVAALAKIPLLNRILFGGEAEAAVGNFCAITGTVSGYHDADDKTHLTFTPSKLLEGSKQYYVVIRGDKNLDSKNGVLNINDIGMAPVNSESLNSIIYQGKVWSFTTKSAMSSNNGICTIDHVRISPDSYLFNTTKNDLNENDSNPGDKSFDTIADSDKVFFAEAVDNKDQVLASTPEYSWTWNWASSKTSVADFGSVTGLSEDKKLVRAKEGVTDDRTTITATANTGSATFSADAQAYVFTCKNPWPPIGSDGTWEPWRDGVEGMSCLSGSGTCSNTNHELYYCRDAGAEGTADDLPAILSNNTIIRGASPAQLKEFYFLREAIPTSTANLLVGDHMVGGEVEATWGVVAGASGYKLYYGPASGRYNNFIDVGSATNKVITGLNNGQTYYFTVTAYFNTGAESPYASEQSVVPTDQTPPAMPTGFSVTPGANSVKLSWNPNSDDAVKYKVYYGVNHAIYGKSIDVGSATSTVISGLTSTSTLYYFTVSALDKYDNESLKADELIVNLGVSATLYKNALANVDFETGSIGGVPANWSRITQSNSSIGITTNAAFSGSRSILVHQDPNEVYPGTCGQSLCESLGGCSWIVASSQCQFASADACGKSVGPAIYNNNENLCWPNTNRTMFASLYYDVSNLKWQVGKKYLIAFYYKGTTSGNIYVNFSFNPGWTSQCASKIVPYINLDGSCKSSYGGTCANNSSRCCVHAPIQTDCYNPINLNSILAGTHTGVYGGWNLYMTTFDYTPAAAGWLDKTGNLHNVIGITANYNNTGVNGTDLYIDNLIVAESI